MKATWTILCLALLALGNGRTQEITIPDPPAELAKFTRLLGNWEGKGVTKMALDGPEIPWTATSRYTTELNGFFIGEDTVVNIGPDLPRMVFRTLYGYDPGTKRYRSVGLGNMGGVWESEVHWADDDTMMNANTGVEDGQVVVDRWVTKLKQDEISFVGMRGAGAGPFYEQVKGDMRRVAGDIAETELSDVKALAPAAAEMRKLLRMKGRYRLSGSYRMGPDVAPIAILGEERIIELFEGSVMGVHIKGDPAEGLGGPAYEAYAGFSWDAANACYKTISANNRGEIGSGEARWVGEDLVVTGFRMQMGQPVQSRTVVKVDAEGRLRHGEAHVLMGVSEPLRSFEAIYTPQTD
ncbi:MAG TPA: DUF1579 family protein [Verrucomicrobiales bacterium]|nr:DUF1579 family protein [Verrucomicrobiales bacterium]